MPVIVYLQTSQIDKHRTLRAVQTPGVLLMVVSVQVNVMIPSTFKPLPAWPLQPEDRSYALLHLVPYFKMRWESCSISGLENISHFWLRKMRANCLWEGYLKTDVRENDSGTHRLLCHFMAGTNVLWGCHVSFLSSLLSNESESFVVKKQIKLFFFGFFFISKLTYPNHT